MKKIINFEKKLFKLENDLYHLGSMNIESKSRYSYEGDGLSVSICPEAWSKIARICSDTLWKLEKKDIKLLNYYSLTEADFKIISEIGVKNGFLTKIISYKHTYYDDEFEAEYSSLYENFSEALVEAYLEDECESYEEYLNIKDEGCGYIEKIIAYSPTEKLKKASFIEVNLSNADLMHFLLYLEHNTDLDGVYWDEILDASRLSAPRGVIFNSKLNTFSKTKLKCYF